MRKICLTICLFCLVMFCLPAAFAGNKDVIKKNVDGIVKAINKGKKANTFKPNDYDPYVFIMKKNGVLVVHPSLPGESLKKKAPPVYEALLKSKSTGVWVDYVWKEKQKHSYVRTTTSGLIVGAGYSE